MDDHVLRTRLDGDLGRREITAEGQALTLGVELAASGHGYATEACAAVLDLAFDRSSGLGLHRVVAQMDARFKGAWADLVIYAVLDDEWKARRNRAGIGTARLDPPPAPDHGAAARP